VHEDLALAVGRDPLERRIGLRRLAVGALDPRAAQKAAESLGLGLAGDGGEANSVLHAASVAARAGGAGAGPLLDVVRY
jgi:hypothetical protein